MLSNQSKIHISQRRNTVIDVPQNIAASDQSTLSAIHAVYELVYKVRKGIVYMSYPHMVKTHSPHS